MLLPAAGGDPLVAIGSYGIDPICTSGNPWWILFRNQDIILGKINLYFFIYYVFS